MKKLILFSAGIVFYLSSFAQQDAMFTHYMYNTIAVNPGYAGSREALTISGLHRSQWISFPGAPTTQSLTIHTPLDRPELGLGLSVVNDKIGPRKFNSFFVDLSYSLDLNNDAKLSFGLKGGLSELTVNLPELETIETNDPTFQNGFRTVLPNVGTGLYYHSKTYYVGVSVPRIIQNNFLKKSASDSSGNGKERRHYFVIAGTVMDVNENIKFKPTTFIKMTSGAPIEADLTGIFIFNDKFWTGAMVRTGDAIGALLGMFVQPNFEIGYSFDWSYGLKTGRYNAGSHEIMVRYDFIYNNKAKIRSPRYF